MQRLPAGSARGACPPSIRAGAVLACNVRLAQTGIVVGRTVWRLGTTLHMLVRMGDACSTSLQFPSQFGTMVNYMYLCGLCDERA